MQDIVNFINEGNISNAERQYREFVSMCKIHGVDPADITVRETRLHNWEVLRNNRKVFLASRYILNPTVIEKYNITKAE